MHLEAIGEPGVDELIEHQARAGVVPEYAPMLAALHRAHEQELRAVLRSAGVRRGDHVLDVACGDGAYTVWLSELVGEQGSVTGVDISKALLRLAEQRARAAGCERLARFCEESVENLPFDDQRFDLAWCAQSLYSLPNPIVALREVARVVKVGGRVVVLENDAFHHVVLPWPADIELRILRAQLDELNGSGRIGKYTVGRWMADALACAGLPNASIGSRSVTRSAPLMPAELSYLERYLAGLRECVERRLPAEERAEVRPWLDPASRHYVLRLANLQVTYLYIVANATKP